jgi:hypothetical protein
MFIYVDENVQNRESIDEWLKKDIKEAVEHYLG